jgi:hypothetical protein
MSTLHNLSPAAKRDATVAGRAFVISILALASADRPRPA